MDHRKQVRLVVKKGHRQTFKNCHTNLLIAIDNNDCWGVRDALRKDKINVNDLYVIPPPEAPLSDKWVFETFLHRALRKNAQYVFGLLLFEGADPRIKGSRNTTVIEDIFDSRMHCEKSTFEFGKMLVDNAGLTTREILETIMRSPKLWNQSKSPYLKPLVNYANICAKTKATKIVHNDSLIPVILDSTRTRE